MAWYDTGTVSVTNGSTTVTGSGTNFVAGAQVGEGFNAPDGRLYEIQSITSATVLVLADAYLGSTQTGQAYKIVPTQSLVANLASQVSTLITDYQDVADGVITKVKASDGTAGSPSISFNLDQDTGFFHDTANEIAVSVAGTKRAEFNSSGMDITGTATMDGLTLNSGGFDYINSGSFLYTNVPSGYSTTIQAGGLNIAKFISGGDISFYEDTGTTAKFLWDASAEKLEIGTSTDKLSLADGSLRIKKDNANKVFIGNTADALGSGTGLINYLYNAEPFIWWQGTERMRIDSSGNLLVGTTTQYGADGVTLQANGMGYFRRASNMPLYLRRDTSDGTIIHMEKDGATVGSIGSLNGVAGTYFGTGNTGISAYSNVIRPVDASTGAYRDNAINIGTTSNRFKDLYLSGGVYLGGTGSANYLDDYESGTFTPTLSSSGTAPTVSSYAIRTGYYTKVGNVVTCQIYIRCTITSAGTGSPIINGLPFTSVGGLAGVSTGLFTQFSSFDPRFNYVAGSNVYFEASSYTTGTNAYICFTVSYDVA